MNIPGRQLAVFLLCLLLISPLTVHGQDGKIQIIDTISKQAPSDHKAGQPRTATPSTVGLRAKNKPGSRPATLATRALASKLSARSAIVLDARTGETIYAQHPDLPGQPASTLKVLTGLIAMQTLKNSDLVPVSGRAAQMPRSKIYLDRNKSYQADDLINAVLLASANDASVALAERVAGSEATFAKFMTRKARQLGAAHTVCKTATGLTAKGQCSTVRDLAVIFNEAMTDHEFAKRIGRTKIQTSDGKTLHNHNRALWQIAGTEGGKTGYTRAARQTFVGKFSRQRDALLVAIMGSETMWTDVSALVEYGFNQKRKMRLAQNRPRLESPLPVRELTGARQSHPPQHTALVIIADIAKTSRL